MLKRSSYTIMIFALLVLCGGIIGFATKQSLVSLVMGISFFIGLFLSGLALLKKKAFGAYLASIFSSAFFMLFLVRLLLNWKIFPTLVMLILSLPVVVLSFSSVYRLYQLQKAIES